VILGKLFASPAVGGSMPSVDLPDERASRRIHATGGRSLITDYWGRYIAIIHDELSRTARVLRDPLGAIPCYLCQHRGVHIVFSYMDDLRALRLMKFSINWQYVAAFLVRSFPMVQATGLDQVTQLLPGECLAFSPGSAPERTQYWDPVRVASRAPIESLEEAAQEARSLTNACVSAWASCFPRIVNETSGGLDSSIVLACLQQAASKPQITCVHECYGGSDADELSFARLVTNSYGCELIEQHPDIAGTTLRVESVKAGGAVPWRYISFLSRGTGIDDLARERRAGVFSGFFGDQLFWRGHEFSATDYALQRGLDAQFLRIALDSAGAEKDSLWSILSTALRAKLTWSPRDYRVPVRSVARFISPAVISEFQSDSNRFITPRYLRDTVGLPPGKLRHIDMLTAGAGTYSNPYAGREAPYRDSPLGSQPLFELFLRMPTYVMTAEGMDRAVARRAFADDVPPGILGRRTKGTVGSSYRRLLRNNQGFLQELFLEGALLREKLLDRGQLEAFFTELPHHAATGIGLDVIPPGHMDLEIWLRDWSGSAQAVEDVAA
jgi:asparagine synthase (glutamine-hydrolysing)